MQTIERFGPGNCFVGVLTGDDRSTQPVLVLPNPGVVPRTGPFRLHVEIARRLEPHGIRTFRFDLPGSGESPHVAGMDNRTAMQAALDHLGARDIATRFVVGGLCTAADSVWLAAVDDPRVVGAILLDGIAFRGPWFQLARIAELFARPPGDWVSIVRSRFRRGAAVMPKDVYRDWPKRAEARAQLTAMLHRDMRFLFIYTGAITDYFRDQRQFAWSFGRSATDPRVTCDFWRDCDHTFYARFARERVLDVLEEWFTTAFGSARQAR